MAAEPQRGSLEEFEDDFDPDLDISRSTDKVWLVKLPKWLLEHWSKVDEDNVELASVIIPNSSSAITGSKLKLMLPDTPENSDTPKEFTINMTNTKVTNTFVFSERDIHVKKEQPQQPASQPSVQNGAARFSPYPKLAPTNLEATSIVGTVAHECTLTPVMNASYSKTVKNRVQEANQPKRQVRMLSDSSAIPDGSYLYNPKSNQPFGKFTGGSTRTKADAQNNKATRIPKNELLDLLFKCFQEYAYWSLKGLREYVKQPESYLREALEEIAHLNKRGPYALKWSLKPHYSHRSDDTKAQGDEGIGGTNTLTTKVESDIDDNVKIEDAL